MQRMTVARSTRTRRPKVSVGRPSLSLHPSLLSPLASSSSPRAFSLALQHLRSRFSHFYSSKHRISFAFRPQNTAAGSHSNLEGPEGGGRSREARARAGCMK